ncbi:hypothetical protein BGX34_001047 [Mortierella sp. NVP85]|nr:hypothetical protein BGX34_001047 [Mortierella sp. NVP85]
MGSTLDSFDTLCQQVFMTNSGNTTVESTPDSQSDEEIALGLVIRAQVYELPASYTFPTTALEGTDTSLPNNDQDRRCYRIHLETIDNDALQQRVHAILLKAIDPSVLLELPYDRNLSGYTSKTRTETKNAPLEAPVVLDMGGLSASDEGTITTQSHNDDKTMLLISTKEWLRMTARVRFWRAESHRIKTAQREAVLDTLLTDRWRSATSHVSPAAISSPPPPSLSSGAPARPPTSIPSSPITSEASTPTTPISPSIPSPTLTPPLRSSPFKQTFQEHQLDFLVQFMTQYGDEPSVSALLRGLLDLIRRQLTEVKVLAWTFDRANLTEQKPEATVAFLDLIARLGLELVVLNQVEESKKTISASVSPSIGTASSSTSESTAVASTAAATCQNTSTELTWTFGPKVDDRRLEYWVHHVQQATLPVLKMDEHSLLPSTASFAHGSSSKSQLVQDQQQNPIPLAIRKRFLQDRNTIPAGTIRDLTSHTHLSTTGTGTAPPVVRDRSYVLATSRYAMSTNAGASSSGPFTDRVKDVIHLARWASTCGGRLDWIWVWLFSSFQRARYGSTANRRSRPNDENV